MEPVDYVKPNKMDNQSISTAVAPSAFTRSASAEDADLVHQVYCAAPAYFDVISIPHPTLIEVRGELEAASGDERRFTELFFAPKGSKISSKIIDPVTGRYVVGYLDFKLDYPETGDGTVNLLLIPEELQSNGLGRLCVLDLEQRLKGQASRLLASIFGQNPRAEQFWKNLGYEFAIDAQPILDWYAKEL